MPSREVTDQVLQGREQFAQALKAYGSPCVVKEPGTVTRTGLGPVTGPATEHTETGILFPVDARPEDLAQLATQGVTLYEVHMAHDAYGRVSTEATLVIDGHALSVGGKLGGTPLSYNTVIKATEKVQVTRA